MVFCGVLYCVGCDFCVVGIGGVVGEWLIELCVYEVGGGDGEYFVCFEGE